MIAEIDKQYGIPYGVSVWGIKVPAEQAKEIVALAEATGKGAIEVAQDLITQGLTCRRVHTEKKPAHIRTGRRK